MFKNTKVTFNFKNKKISGILERRVWIYTGNNKDELFYVVISENRKNRYTVHNRDIVKI